jgi:hypothetical protein
MYPSLPKLSGLVALTTLFAPVAVASNSRSSPPLPTRQVYQFPNPTWIENIWTRSNGDLLVTEYYPTAAVYLISSPASSSATATLLHTFPNLDGLLGVIETSPGLVTVFGHNYTTPGSPINGTSQVWELDLRVGKRPAPAHLVADIPEAVFLNGVYNTPDEDGAILISDSSLGLVWRVDTTSGDYEVAVQDAAMNPVVGAGLKIGINGITVNDGYLYWTNSFEAAIYRVKITDQGFRAPSAAVKLVANLTGKATFLDDLVIGPGKQDGIWTLTNLDNTLILVDDKGTGEIVAGSQDQLTLASGTAGKFGARTTDADILYVVTAGGFASPVNGTLVEGGLVVAVDTKQLCKRSLKGSKSWVA